MSATNTMHCLQLPNTIGGDLMKLLIKEDIFTEDVTRFYMAETAAAIGALHDMDFVHRDLKPDNILIAKDGHIKLSDFGLASYNAAVLEESVSKWTEELSRDEASGGGHVHHESRRSRGHESRRSRGGSSGGDGRRSSRRGPLSELKEEPIAEEEEADSGAEEEKKKGLFGFTISVFTADGKKKKKKKKKKRKRKDGDSSDRTRSSSKHGKHKHSTDEYKKRRKEDRYIIAICLELS